MRPFPPNILTEQGTPDDFLPGNIAEFVHNTFLNEDSPLYNEEHIHLLSANVGYLWTNVANMKAGRQILGTAEIIRFQGGKWQRERQAVQFSKWFGIEQPDFLITLDAMYCEQAPDLEFCALLEHELYHCGQAKDEFGAPKFNRETGLPMFALRGHCVEQFVGIVERYGADAAGVRELVDAANAKPLFDAGEIKIVCGTCLR
jgi:hypothetical protein